MIRKLTLAVLFLSPALALAQGSAARVKQATSPAPAAAAPGAADAADAGDLALPAATEQMEGAPREGEAAGAVPPPDAYTIRPGDTLWDLSGRFLNNPWYWPKIWSYNPEITNPHWIYPGNLLRFYQSGEEGPGQVAPVAPEVAEEETEEAEPAHELEDLSRVDMARAATDEEKDAVAVAGPHKIGFVAPRTPYTRRDAFITPRELEGAGTIRSAFEEKSLLTTRDRAYATFRSPASVKVGETYGIYRTLRPVTHPVTKELIGYQSIVLGSAKVVALDARAATLSITSSFDTIERGDLLGPWTEKPYRAVPLKANAKQLRGYIVSAPVEFLTQVAQYQVVFVDLGKVDGVQEGNRLTVVRAGDPTGSTSAIPTWDHTSPIEDVGSLLVVDVKEHSSASLVTRSLSELGPGDRVEMRMDGDGK